MADYGIGAADGISRLSLDEGRRQPPSSRPDVHSAGIVAVDITQKFDRAVKTLQPGELVKDGFFTLFDSVAALEIMDTKMDSGCVLPGEEFEVLYDVSRPLLPEEVLGIMDQLICHEMSWHLGYPLAQTIFTSVYVDALLMPEPGSIEQAYFVRNNNHDANGHPMLEVLRAYCLGMLKACAYVNERIKAEHFYEEEDFVPNTYNRTLLTGIPSDAIQDVIIHAVELVLTLKGSSISDDVAHALISRLDLRSVFLTATESPQYMKEPLKARESWDKAVKILSQIKSTNPLGTAVDDAFSNKLQRKLASTMPPRPIVQLKFDDAFGHLSRLFKDGSEVIGVLEYTDSQCLQTFVSTFQSKKPQPMVYIRTLLQTFLFNEMEILGSMSIRQLLDDDLSIITLPSHQLLDRSNDEIEATHDPRFTMSQQMELFRQRAAQPFLDIFRTACQNRCRVRRTLCHLIRDWENLQVDAESIDEHLQIRTKEQPFMQRSSHGLNPIEMYSLPLSSWTYLYKLRQMEVIVQLGFELEVYQTDELVGMYWYLNYLAKSRLHHVERIKTFLVRRTSQVRSQALDLSAEEQLQRSLTYMRLSMLDAAVTWELSDALSCVYTVLHRFGLVKAPPRPYSNDELRYDLRMKPFACIGLPTLPAFEEFTAGITQPDLTTAELLQYAEQAVTGAKRGSEALTKFSARESFSVGSHERWMVTAKGVLKSCIATGVAISTLRKALQRTEGHEHAALEVSVSVPTPDKAYHEWWIVPRIVPQLATESDTGL
ncbi:N-alpha-acetyltransferase, non-catalitic subunit [Conoideocrella luteorostrata]|uniref:N-alpha-acetyltransferase, non-catalitic subunit n=1 Tax=Conoideocrella luteorostrata TaxID=1105319 RepID=A0AAJ0FU21_9HYPO|nr:N-alpha-acetyltransferase, non-catalitic subunit [Conoideocrella luteorostrata]